MEYRGSANPWPTISTNLSESTKLALKTAKICAVRVGIGSSGWLQDSSGTTRTSSPSRNSSRATICCRDIGLRTRSCRRCGWSGRAHTIPNARSRAEKAQPSVTTTSTFFPTPSQRYKTPSADSASNAPRNQSSNASCRSTAHCNPAAWRRSSFLVYFEDDVGCIFMDINDVLLV